jgi:hypothetical protein
VAEITRKETKYLEGQAKLTLCVNTYLESGEGELRKISRHS